MYIPWCMTAWVPFSSFSRTSERLDVLRTWCGLVVANKPTKAQLAVCNLPFFRAAAACCGSSALAIDAPHIMERPLLMSFDSMTGFSSPRPMELPFPNQKVNCMYGNDHTSVHTSRYRNMAARRLCRLAGASLV